jgi:YbgC/YbaW family acyl-CoA thioester hydrolase
MSNVENKTTQITDAVVAETVVRCTETDVNGHLNNAKFVEYLEWGREEWYESHGFAYDRLEELGAITVVVNINLNYRQPCHQGDRLRIITSPLRRGHSSFALAQQIEKSDGTVAADGVVTIVTVDPDTRRAVPLPEELAGLFRAPD